MNNFLRSVYLSHQEQLNQTDTFMMAIQRAFYGILPALIVPLGWTANMLAFLVYASDKFKKNYVYIYLCSLAVSDSLALVDYLIEFLEFNFNVNIFSCQTVEYISFVPSCLSAWTIVLVSGERMLNITFSNAKLTSSLNNNKLIKLIILVAIGIATSVAFLPVLIVESSQPDDESSFKYCQNKSHMLIVFWLDLIGSVVLPAILMFTFNLFTITRVLESRKKTHVQFYVHLNRRKRVNRLNRRDRMFAVTSFSLNFLFLVLNLPTVVLYLVCFYYNSGLITAITERTKENAELMAHFIPVGDFVYSLSCLQLLFTSLLVNSIFRNEFKAKVCAHCNRFSRSNKITSGLNQTSV
jgi:hypothetical protein